eukprot:COSAG05_NODE_153_length_15894_cov_27.910415_21_plen_66_part_00
MPVPVTCSGMHAVDVSIRSSVAHEHIMPPLPTTTCPDWQRRGFCMCELQYYGAFEDIRKRTRRPS